MTWLQVWGVMQNKQVVQVVSQILIEKRARARSDQDRVQVTCSVRLLCAPWPAFKILRPMPRMRRWLQEHCARRHGRPRSATTTPLPLLFGFKTDVQ